MLLYILGAVAVIALGAWLKWAVVPVTGAFRLGLELGKAAPRAGRTSREHLRPLSVLLALLMPWRAVAEIQECREGMVILARTAGDLLKRHDELAAKCGMPTIADLDRLADEAVPVV